VASNISDADLATAIALLKKNSSINAVSDYFKKHSVAPFSAGSWPELVDSRIKPALDRGDLTRKDILQLLIDSEEYGRQHVFLYQCSPKTEIAYLLDESTVRQRLSKLDLEGLYERPRIVERPKGLQLVDVRHEQNAPGKALIIKAVNLRRRRNLLKKEEAGDLEILTYQWEEDRAIYVLRLSQNGLAEVRIQSYRNSIDYAKEAEEFFAKCTGIIDRFKFEDFSLAPTRLHMIQKRKTLTTLVRFGENTLRSKKGGGVRVFGSDWAKNMYEDDEELDGSVETFLSKGKGKSKCDEVNCTWLKRQGNSAPLSDIHTFIGGANNEFVVLPQCERSDYEYVLEKITGFSK
jgi:hypothetical protein